MANPGNLLAVMGMGIVGRVRATCNAWSRADIDLRVEGRVYAFAAICRLTGSVTV